MSPPPNGQEMGPLQKFMNFIRGQVASIQQNISLTRNSLMSQRTTGVGTILQSAPARVANLGILPILRQAAPTGAPAGQPPTTPPTTPGVTPQVEVTVTPAPTGDISQEFQAI